jgi:calcineurin-like phosphoesterase family protein
LRLVLVAFAAGVLVLALALGAARGRDEGSPGAGADTAPAVPVEGVRIAAAGDIACAPGEPARDDECRQGATSDLLVGIAGVLALGDLQYEDGTYEKFLASYDRSWGQAKAITAPTPGNHEYRTQGAAGYFRYFGAAAGDRTKGYYSFELGGWHLVALNSNCSAVGGCDEGSPQERWLRADLAAHPAFCTLAYWHHPRFSSGKHGSDPAYTAFWQALYEADADVVLVGHDHDYERFAPQDAFGRLALVRGIREFVVGTGGKSLRSFRASAPNSEVRDAASFGVLELTLGADAYAWRFRSTDRSVADSGSASCH